MKSQKTGFGTHYPLISDRTPNCPALNCVIEITGSEILFERRPGLCNLNDKARKNNKDNVCVLCNPGGKEKVFHLVLSAQISLKEIIPS